MTGRKYIKKKKSIFVSVIVSLSLIMCGCGSKEENAPELLEPVTTNESYRPVEYGEIGRNIIKTGSVVSEDYCHFFTTAGTFITIDSIDVCVGDYVEAGDILVTADKKEAEEALETSRSELDNKIATQNINQKIYEANQEKLDWMIKAYDEAGDTETADMYRTQKAVNAENNRYDKLLYEHQISKLEQEIDEKQKLCDDNTIKARHSGYVTYVKDLSASYQVENMENIVIVSDYSDTYIEITNEEVKSKAYDGFNKMYTVINGEKYDIEEYKYSNEELAKAQSSGKYPLVRFKLKDASVKLPEIGNLVPLYFSTSDVSDVLIVGNDSLQEEGENNYVYVKNESGEKERRDIVTGASDEYYTEVVSGLSEGELVYYASDIMVPSNYTEYNVGTGNIRKTAASKTQSVMPVSYRTYSSPVDGECELLNVARDDHVDEGDLLFTIDSGGGSAELVQMEIQIQNAKDEYNDSVNASNEEIASIAYEIKQYENGTKKEGYNNTVATPGDAEYEDGDNTLYMTERLTCDLNIAKYNREMLDLNYDSQMDELTDSYNKLKENNDGTGKVSVYAKESGTVSEIYYVDGNSLAAGDLMLSVGSESNMKIVAKIAQDKPHMVINQKITFVDKENEAITISGRCIGSSGGSNKVYVSTIDDKVYVTSTDATEYIYYYIEADDDSYYDSPESYQVFYDTMTLENAVTVPNSMVYTETNKKNGRVYHYVWKLAYGEVYKQYVQVDDTLKDNFNTCILSGVSEGDVLVREAGGQ